MYVAALEPPPPPPPAGAARSPGTARQPSRVCMVHNRQWGVGYRRLQGWRLARVARFAVRQSRGTTCLLLSGLTLINVHSLWHRLVRSRQYAQKVSSVVLGFLRLKISKHGVSVYCRYKVYNYREAGCEAGDVWVTVVKTSNVEYF